MKQEKMWKVALQKQAYNDKLRLNFRQRWLFLQFTKHAKKLPLTVCIIYSPVTSCREWLAIWKEGERDSTTKKIVSLIKHLMGIYSFD